jgi:hypothetical protein
MILRINRLFPWTAFFLLIFVNGEELFSLQGKNKIFNVISMSFSFKELMQRDSSRTRMNFIDELLEGCMCIAIKETKTDIERLLKQSMLLLCKNTGLVSC